MFYFKKADNEHKNERRFNFPNLNNLLPALNYILSNESHIPTQPKIQIFLECSFASRKKHKTYQYTQSEYHN